MAPEQKLENVAPLMSLFHSVQFMLAGEIHTVFSYQQIRVPDYGHVLACITVKEVNGKKVKTLFVDNPLVEVLPLPEAKVEVKEEKK